MDDNLVSQRLSEITDVLHLERCVTLRSDSFDATALEVASVKVHKPVVCSCINSGRGASDTTLTFVSGYSGMAAFCPQSGRG
jgi:hypothetical protein